MIQSVLVFTLGFLAAALLALVAGPSLWRRAVRLTRRQVLATTPMTLNEIEAEKDRMRAAFAMEIRQIEMKLDAARERNARLMVDLGATEERARTSGVARDAAAREKAGLARELAEAQDEATRLTEALHVANAAIGRLESDLAMRGAENEALTVLQEETALKAGSLQIELAERESDIDRLHAAQRASGPAGVEDMPAGGQLRATEEALRAEKRKAADLRKKLAAAEANLAAMERDIMPPGGADASEIGSKTSGKVLSLDNARMAAENAALREQVLDLAARMVAATAAEEGVASPINAALDQGAASGGRSGLADRIRALQKSASSHRN